MALMCWCGNDSSENNVQCLRISSQFLSPSNLNSWLCIHFTGKTVSRRTCFPAYHLSRCVEKLMHYLLKCLSGKPVSALRDGYNFVIRMEAFTAARVPPVLAARFKELAEPVQFS